MSSIRDETLSGIMYFVDRAGIGVQNRGISNLRHAKRAKRKKAGCRYSVFDARLWIAPGQVRSSLRASQ
jgi:hypothetical protein